MKWQFLLLCAILVGCRSATIEERAARGDRQAMVELAGNYFFGENGYERDWVRGEELLSRLTLRGDTRAAHQLAMISFIRRDYDEAINRFERAARMGDTASSLMAATLLQMEGCGGGSATRMFEHLEGAVARGDKEGERQLSRLVVGLQTAATIGALDERSVGCYVEAHIRGYYAEKVET